MVSSRNRYEITEKQANPNAQENNGDGQRKKISEYELSREERIRKNLERMKKLGIFDLSLKVKALKPTPKARNTSSIRRTPQYSSPLPPTGSVRRSSRLQNVTPVSYSEAYLTKKDKPLESEDDLLREEGSKPEFYTEEHEKLLGSTERSWTLFVDGVGNDGKRIYDPVKGKTCHQCRQKTLGHRTHCSKCNLVQGQFCGDCLYMRYGENVIEASQNPNWICPVCRGICNCSLCRQAKGWPPTGPLYRKISSLGYKSVAHYLIQTLRLKTETEADSSGKVSVSVKRSLPFSHVEEISREMVSMECNANPQMSENPQSECKNAENLPCAKQEEKTDFADKEQADCEQEEKTHFLDNEQGDCKLDAEMKLVFPTLLNAENSLLLDPRGTDTAILVDNKYDCSNFPGKENTEILNNENNNQKEALQTEPEPKCNESHHEFKGKEDKTSYLGNRYIDCLAPEPSPRSNSIVGRLRPRRNINNEHNEEQGLTGAKNGTLGGKQDLNNVSSQHSTEATITDNIAGRLRQRRAKGKKQEINELSSPAKAETTIDISSPVAAVTSSKSNKKRIHTSEPSCDSIARRLRQRRAQAGGA